MRLHYIPETTGETRRGTIGAGRRKPGARSGDLHRALDGVQVTYNLSGLPPDSDHALQVHERGDCNSADGSSLGAIFAPAAERLKTGARVEGDLGNIHADSNGVATGFIVAPDVSLDGIRSVLQRAVVVHRDASDPYAWPQHGAGAPLACGVIHQ
jgi:Cu-Zn family superoxide dismutase